MYRYAAHLPVKFTINCVSASVRHGLNSGFIVIEYRARLREKSAPFISNIPKAVGRLAPACILGSLDSLHEHSIDIYRATC